MKIKMTLDRTSTGTPDIVGVVNELQAAINAEKPDDRVEFTVQRAVRVAAEKELLEKARQLAFSSHRPLTDSIFEIARREPALFRLSRAPIDLDFYADVRVKA